jgi:hypothetical protein
MALGGRLDEARQTIDAAVALFLAKGDGVSAARAARWSAALC